MKTAMPYPTPAGEVTLQVVGAKVDGRALPLHMISRTHQVVALHEVERREWDEVRLELRAELPRGELSAGAWRDVVCVAVLTEGATNARTTARLSGTAEDGVRTGSITLTRGSHRSRAELSLYVVATVEGVPGRIIGGTEESWIVDLQAREPVRERELVIHKVDFRNTDEEWLRPYRDAPWLIETTGEMPTVHLNTGFEGIEDLLEGSGNPVEKAVRGMLAAQIATEAWTAMFQAAVDGLDVEDGVPQWPTGWRDRVLRGLVGDVFPDLSPADALRELHARRSEGGRWAELQPRIHYAAARRARLARNLGTTVRTLERSGEDNRR
ncbi:hypothetical protein [Streptomyces aidingensis]|uniref:Uncharacterized protein n=1 Tax=Streptomyces aidingensis TaxID=910347 RepID=A0A1I1U1W5_9ACTN|nr:hypothetical protein [Streptomyces aidingensis]SFD62673.1 hypothetical protein SAMN05421773_12160 [Streptomyces aidingensis]